MKQSLRIPLLIVLGILLVATFAMATWIIVSPDVPWNPTHQNTKLFIHVELDKEYGVDYNAESPATYSSLLSQINADTEANIKFFDQFGKEYKLTTPLNAASIYDGADYYSDENKAVGNTYVAGYLIAISSLEGYVNGLYEWDSSYHPGAYLQLSYNRLLKYKTVQIGTLNNTSWTADSNTWYTMEDALNTATQNTANNRDRVIKIAGDADGDLVTSFTSLTRAQSGYNGDSYYTIKSGVTLLLPYADGVNSVNNTSVGDAPSKYVDGNGNPTKSARPFSEVVIPLGINVANAGTINVAAFTGAKDTGSLQNGISGGWSQIKLDGTLMSTGTLNVYGSVIGSGNILAISGTVNERFEITDWRGGTGAAGAFLGDKVTINLLGTTRRGKDEGNIFPFKCYELRAISVTMRVNANATYSGSAKIYTSKVSIIDETFTSRSFVISAPLSGSNGLFKFSSASAYLEKIVKGERVTIRINGGATGGDTTFDIKVATATAEISSGAVSFPITGTVDLILESGNYSSDYGYKLLPGATFTLQNNANLTLSNVVKGFTVYKTSDINYSGSGEKYPSGRPDGKFVVKGDSSLYVTGSFGGEIIGEKGAVVDISSTAKVSTNSIEGSGSLDTSKLTTGFVVTSNITEYANGEMYPGANGNFATGQTYLHNGSYWVGSDVKFNITYRYLVRNSDGSIEEYAGYVTCNNPTSYTILDNLSLVFDTITGLTPQGWFRDIDCTEPIEFINGGAEMQDLVLYALFEQTDAYLFTFDTDVEDFSINAFKTKPSIGDQIVKPEELDTFLPKLIQGGELYESITVYDYDVEVKYYFAGWKYFDSDGNEIDTDNLPEANGSTQIRVVAQWIKKVTLTVNVTATGKKGGSGFGASKGASVTASVAIKFSYTDQIKSTSITGEGGEGGLFGGKDGKIVNDQIVAYLKPGQTYAITVNSADGTKITGNSSGTAGTQNITVSVSNS